MGATLLNGLIYLLSVPAALWAAGALFYDAGRAKPLGMVLVILWIVAVSALFVLISPPWKAFAVFALAMAVLLTWWLSQKPSMDRDWDPNYARLPSMVVDGDQLTIHNLRNTDYQPDGQTTPRFETRRYRMSQLRGVDALVLTFGVPTMSHPMFVFDFGEDGRVCISIEVRYRVGQDYDLLRSIYRQQELIYVVSDERDSVLRRTLGHADRNLYLYRLTAEPLIVHQFFLEYANSVNHLAETPRWYNGITRNCTTSIYSQAKGRMQWDWRILFNGALGRMMYELGILDQTLPYDELKQQSRVTDIANRAPAEGFSDYLRSELPGYSPHAVGHHSVASLPAQSGPKEDPPEAAEEGAPA